MDSKQRILTPNHIPSRRRLEQLMKEMYVHVTKFKTNEHTDIMCHCKHCDLQVDQSVGI